MEGQWQLWHHWLLLLDSRSFPEIMVCKESIGRFLFPWLGAWSRKLFAATMNTIFEMEIVVGTSLAAKLNDWFEKMVGEKLITTAEEDIEDYKAHLKKKLL